MRLCSSNRCDVWKIPNHISVFILPICSFINLLFKKIMIILIFCFNFFLINVLYNHSFFLCPESRRTYIATVSKILFFPIELKRFSPRFGPLGLRNCNKNFVCLSVVCLSNEISRRPIGHSFGSICMKFGTLVYLWDT